MKRTLYEWTAILAGMFGLVCVGYWGTSFFVRLPVDKLRFLAGPLGVQPTATLAEGVFEWCSDSQLEDVLLNPLVYYTAPASNRVITSVDWKVLQYAHVEDSSGQDRATLFAMPGIMFRYCNLQVARAERGWSVRVSTLLVGSLALIVALTAQWRLQLLRRALEASGIERPPSTNVLGKASM